jgi:hypothetical protein
MRVNSDLRVGARCFLPTYLESGQAVRLAPLRAVMIVVGSPKLILSFGFQIWHLKTDVRNSVRDGGIHLEFIKANGWRGGIPVTSVEQGVSLPNDRLRMKWTTD